MTSKTILVHSLLSPDALRDIMRHEGQLKHARDLPIKLQSTGVHAARFKLGKDTSFQIDLDGVPTRGASGVDIVGRGRLKPAPDGGSEIALSIGGSRLTRLQPLLACGFCAYVVFHIWREGYGLDGLAPVAIGLPLLWFVLWAEVTRLVNLLEPGLMQLVERLATGSLHAARAASESGTG